MIYTASSKMRMETGDKNINVTGKVLLVSLFPKPTNSFKKPVMITIKNTVRIRYQLSDITQLIIWHYPTNSLILPNQLSDIIQTII